jgi:hypothetical protein
MQIEYSFLVMKYHLQRNSNTMNLERLPTPLQYFLTSAVDPHLEDRRHCRRVRRVLLLLSPSSNLLSDVIGQVEEISYLVRYFLHDNAGFSAVHCLCGFRNSLVFVKVKMHSKHSHFSALRIQASSQPTFLASSVSYLSSLLSFQPTLALFCLVQQPFRRIASLTELAHLSQCIQFARCWPVVGFPCIFAFVRLCLLAGSFDFLALVIIDTCCSSCLVAEQCSRLFVHLFDYSTVLCSVPALV